MTRSTITEIISTLFIILFLYTGTSKFIGYAIFKEQIATSPLLTRIAPVLAWVLPLSEIVVSSLLIVPRWRLKGLNSSLLLMILFTGYIIGILIFNKNIPCSCGGVIESLTWTGHIVFNSVFIILAFIGIKLEKVSRQQRKDD
jgi:uncharacterized membrane protein YphA (DoxX/SURF4 family)